MPAGILELLGLPAVLAALALPDKGNAIVVHCGQIVFGGAQPQSVEPPGRACRHHSVQETALALAEHTAVCKAQKGELRSRTFDAPETQCILKTAQLVFAACLGLRTTLFCGSTQKLCQHLLHLLKGRTVLRERFLAGLNDPAEFRRAWLPAQQCFHEDANGIDIIVIRQFDHRIGFRRCIGNRL